MNSANQKSSYLKRLPVEQPTGFKGLLAFLCVLFVAAQIQGLSHSHDEGGLNFQADCDVCLKLSSEDDVIASSDAELPSLLFPQIVAQHANTDLPVELVKFRQARAPPIV